MTLVRGSIEQRGDDMESILNSIKKLLGISEEYTIFDPDLIMHINSIFMVLQQIGVGPKGGFAISDQFTVWDDYLSDPVKLQIVKSYIALRVRLLFDPPTSSAHMESIKQQIAEFEFRLNVAAEQEES